MAATLTPQSARAPLGMVTVGGQQMPVFITPEWLRYLAIDAFKRMGEYDAPTNSELQESMQGMDLAPVAHAPAEPIDPLTPVAVLVQEVQTLETTVAELQALVAVLSRQVLDLQQGYQL